MKRFAVIILGAILLGAAVGILKAMLDLPNWIEKSILPAAVVAYLIIVGIGRKNRTKLGRRAR